MLIIHHKITQQIKATVSTELASVVVQSLISSKLGCCKAGNEQICNVVLKIIVSNLIFCIFLNAAIAIEVNPSKERLSPERGSRPYLFQGDPRRLERANTVQLRDVELNLSVEPQEVSPGRLMMVTLSVFNRSRRPIMLLFPDSQRLEIAVVNDAGNEVYLQSAQKRFDPVEGTTVINRRERVVFTTHVPVSGWSGGIRPGTYRLVAAVSGYPHVQKSQDIVVR